MPKPKPRFEDDFLRPCPFCNSTDVICHEDSTGKLFAMVSCRRCAAQGPRIVIDPKPQVARGNYILARCQAIAAWNEYFKHAQCYEAQLSARPAHKPKPNKRWYPVNVGPIQFNGATIVRGELASGEKCDLMFSMIEGWSYWSRKKHWVKINQSQIARWRFMTSED